MPSGSRRRKAAKKKKAKEQAHIKPSNGNDVRKSHIEIESDGGVKSHDEKESDGGELHSPASQDHQSSQHPFDEGEKEEEEKGRTSSVQPIVPENNLSEVPRNKGDDGVAAVVNELTPKSVKELGDGRSVGDNRNTIISNSDNGEKKEKGSDSVLDVTSRTDTVKPDVHVPEKVSRPIEASQATEACKLVIETDSVVEASEPAHSLPEVGDCNTVTVPVEKLVDPCGAKLGFKGNDLLPSSLGDGEGVVPAMVGLASITCEEKVFPLVNENVRMSSSEASFMSKENEDKLLPPSDASIVEHGNVMDHVKDSEETSGCPEKQPLLDSVSRTTKTTSWKSCCGLFDVLAGSSR